MCPASTCRYCALAVSSALAMVMRLMMMTPLIALYEFIARRQGLVAD